LHGRTFVRSCGHIQNLRGRGASFAGLAKLLPVDAILTTMSLA
jgi:hypothetical protein